MNWTNFQTYNDSPTKAFETLCNQLFENWCKEEFGTKLVSVKVVNGAGGDGGVEAYAVLNDHKIVGLQAKWFPDSFTSNQMSQIKSSIRTALRIRPHITRYIVCVPRDFASITAKSEKAEDQRWEDMKEDILKDYPNLSLELWNETRLTQELQKESSVGIFKFWFERSEISDESVQLSFMKSKESWLNTKYVPELNTFGSISNIISSYLGNIEINNKIKTAFSQLCNLCDRFYDTSSELLDVCGESDPNIVALLNDTKCQIDAMMQETSAIRDWLENQSIFGLSFDESSFWIDFGSVANQLKDSKEEPSHYFLFDAVIKVLHQLDKIRIHLLLNEVKRSNDYRNKVFLGEPGTGKTHGIAAIMEQLLNHGLHIPILIQARDIPINYTWKDIIVSSLGLANSWSEEEIWQGLSSLANRRKMKVLRHYKNVPILPKVLIVVDGIDESSPYDIWMERIKEANVVVKKYPLLRFSFLSRPFVFQDQIIDVKFEYLPASGDVPVHKLFDSYVKAFDVDVSNAGWIKYSLTTPLALKLFCEINKGKTIHYHSGADISISALLKEKIRRLEIEFCKQNTDIKVVDQIILKGIMLLANQYKSESFIERENLTNIIEKNLTGDSTRARKIINYLEDYGILRVICAHGKGLLSPDVYLYYPGIQGYFDYASALMLLDEYVSPSNIDFAKCENLLQNSFYILAIISIQNYNYLITSNDTIKTVISDEFWEELEFFALRHSSPDKAAQFKPKLLDIMAKDADHLRNVTNKIVLPLARDLSHPLGTKLIDEFLASFEYAAQRDVIWSVPTYLNKSEGTKWYVRFPLDINQDAYKLSINDTAEGLPLIFAWALSSVNNTFRQEYRIELMRWALESTDEFFKLFLKFTTVNDPQIRSDVFSILMSLVYERENSELLERAACWIMENILSPEKIEENRDASVRYYSTSIIRKAAEFGVIESCIANRFLPPYRTTSYNIQLSEEALTGTYMGGYGGITYDLGRYVLTDHMTGVFSDYRDEVKNQYGQLIDRISLGKPQYKGISANQLILSMAYAFIQNAGWTEDFRYRKNGEEYIFGVDNSIFGTYMPKTHGSQSPVMTICEKYVWQARNYIGGFLADHLKHVEESDAHHIDDYGVLDNFLIPALEIGHVNPDELNDLYPWHIPESDTVLIKGKPSRKEDVANAVDHAPDISWEKWITLYNNAHQYPINEEILIALNSFSCFECPMGLETMLYINSILVENEKLDDFLELIRNDSNISNQILNPCDWSGGVQTSCYITPKEICWMPWKKRYDCYFADEFPGITINSAVEECTYNFVELGDVGYKLPSAPVRKILGITNTDGFEFYNMGKEIKAINVSVGERWHTQQEQLLTGKSLIELAEKNGKQLVWIMREQRRESGKTREKFGDFYAEKDKSYCGFFRNGTFETHQIEKRELPVRNTYLNNILSQYMNLGESEG